WKTGGDPGTIGGGYWHAKGVGWAGLFKSTPPPSRGFNIVSIAEAPDSLAFFNFPEPSADFASTPICAELSAKKHLCTKATFQPGIVSGSWLSIFGSNLATASRTWRSDEFLADDFSLLPLSVDSVTVTIDGKPAPVSYVSPTQINVQAPTDTATGPVTVIV